MKKNIFVFILLIAVLKLQAQNVTIPDSNFNSFLLNDTTVNINQDNAIQLSEAQAVSHLDISNKGIMDLSGISSFNNLTNLNCSGNLLSSLDISGNIELDTLICDANNLTTVCINSKQYQNITEFPNNWIKDATCEWNRKACSIENDSCFALFYTTFVESEETFYGWVDSLSTEKAVRFNWDFGDLGVSSQIPAPAYYYGKEKLYTICMKMYIASGDSCEYCHTIGYDSLRNIYKHGGGFNFRVKQFESSYSPDSLVIDTLVGINQESSIAATYSIQPNPTADIINIAFKNAVKNISIKLVTTTGHVLLEQKYRSGNRFMLDLRNQANGLYILEIIQNDMVSFSKIIKQ